MRVQVIPIKDFSEDLKKKWLDFQTLNPNLAGPCFHPELFIAVGKFTPEVYVAILRNGKNLIGFLPFRKDKRLLAAKCIEFCYYESIIGRQCEYWDVDLILKKCGLRAWEFVALADFERIKSRNGTFEIIDVPRIDLTGGFEEYIKHRKNNYKRFLYKQRLIERNIGPIRFIPICNDLKVLHQLLP